MLSSEEKRQQKFWEQQQQTEEQISQLIEMENEITDTIEEFKKDAEESLMNDDNDSFEMIAETILYFQDFGTMVKNIRVQFQTTTKTASAMKKLDNIRPILRKTADMLNSLPNINQNNKDFVALQNALNRGKFSTTQLKKMMASASPATQSKNRKADVEAIRESLLMSNPSIGIKQASNTSDVNKSFFDTINGN